VSRAPTRDRLEPGGRIGDYLIDRELEIEETGVVYLGTHAVLPRQAAVKVTHPSSHERRAMAVAMLREACLLEALSHPGIPRVYECGVLGDRRPWTAFERIEGPALAQLIAGAPLPLADLVVILRDVGDLLAHAHARGVVHRRLGADAIVRTPDRGYSICVRRWDDALTLDTEAKVAVNARDDVHALGAVAYRALAGAAPDRNASAAERFPHAPAELTALIDQMLAGEPGSRPPADEIRDRARWLADSFEPLSLERVRWTPPRGLSADALPLHDLDEAPGFSIRIGRGKPSPA
jgi:serine/threonine protein kinase